MQIIVYTTKVGAAALSNIMLELYCVCVCVCVMLKAKTDLSSAVPFSKRSSDPTDPFVHLVKDFLDIASRCRNRECILERYRVNCFICVRQNNVCH